MTSRLGITHFVVNTCSHHLNQLALHQIGKMVTRGGGGICAESHWKGHVGYEEMSR